MTDPQIALMMLGLFIVFVFLGFPIAFTLIILGIVFGALFCILCCSFLFAAAVTVIMAIFAVVVSASVLGCLKCCGVFDDQ